MGRCKQGIWNAIIGAHTRHCKNSKSLALLSLPSSVTSISHVYQIKARGSQARGEAKEKTKLFVETMYGFESGRSKKAIAANRKLAEELKREKGFIYEVSLVFI
jgi:Domain of unknown function (DUF6532)